MYTFLYSCSCWLTVWHALLGVSVLQLPSVGLSWFFPWRGSSFRTRPPPNQLAQLGTSSIFLGYFNVWGSTSLFQGGGFGWLPLLGSASNSFKTPCNSCSPLHAPILTEFKVALSFASQPCVFFEWWLTLPISFSQHFVAPNDAVGQLQDAAYQHRWKKPCSQKLHLGSDSSCLPTNMSPAVPTLTCTSCQRLLLLDLCPKDPL